MHFGESIHCSTHFRALRANEANALPDQRFMEKQTFLNGDLRGTLVDWLIDVGRELRAHSRTTFLAIRLVDRFLSVILVRPEQLQTVGAACMWTAAKYEELHPPSSADMAEFTENSTSVQQIVGAEKEILKALNYELGCVTALDALDCLLLHQSKSSAGSRSNLQLRTDSLDSACSQIPDLLDDGLPSDRSSFTPPPVLFEHSSCGPCASDMSLMRVEEVDYMHCEASLQAPGSPGHPDDWTSAVLSCYDTCSKGRPIPVREGAGETYPTQLGRLHATGGSTEREMPAADNDHLDSCFAESCLKGETAQPQEQAHDAKVQLTANYFCEISLLSHEMAMWLPSQIACSALLLSRPLYDPTQPAWTEELHHLTGYSLADLHACASAMNELHSRVLANPDLHTVLSKYEAIFAEQ